MTTSGVEITKANIVAQFKSIRDTYNNGIVWHSGSHPFNTGATNDYGSTLPVQDGTSNGYATGNIEDNISDTNIVASTLVNQFRSYASSLSRIRYARLIRHYNNNGSDRIDYDQTQIASLRPGYAADMNGISVSNVAFDSEITAANLDQFVANLSSSISSYRNSTQTFNEYYCHSSCHNSCHGSI